MTVRAVARFGADLSGTTTFTHVFATAPDCRSAVVPPAPGYVDGPCTGARRGSAMVIVPSSLGMRYELAGVPVVPGRYRVDPSRAVVVTVHALPGFVVSGVTQYGLHPSSSATCHVRSVRATPPHVALSACTGPNRAEVTVRIPDAVGVSYLANVSAGALRADAEVATVPPGTFVVPAGVPITVRAVARPGYVLVGRRRFTYPADHAELCVVPAPAQFRDSHCTSGRPTGSFYDIPDAAGVAYAVGGRPVTSGEHRAADGSRVVVSAQARPHTELAGITQWSHTFPARPTCVAAPTPIPSPPVTRTPPAPRHGGGGSGPAVGGLGRPAATGTPVSVQLGIAMALLLLGVACLVAGVGRRRT